MNLVIGAKYSQIENNSSNELRYQNGNDWIIDSSLLNQFVYDENIIAGYGELTGVINEFSYLLGVRFESTRMKGESLVSESGSIDRSYNNFFPNIQLSYNLTKDLLLGASYNYRVSRPAFQDLNPYVTFIDSITSLQGNPQLLPAFTHNVELSLIYMEYASIKLGYSKAINPIFLSVEKDETINRFRGINQNLTSSEMYTIGIVVPWENKWWNTFNSFGYNFNKYVYSESDNFVVNNQPTFYVNLYNEFRIRKWFNIELSYEYVSPGAQGIFVGKPYQYIMASLSRDFFGKKLKVNFSMFDPFKLNIERASATLDKFSINYSSWMDSRSFMLTARWNFGKMKDAKMTEIDFSKDGERIKK